MKLDPTDHPYASELSALQAASRWRFLRAWDGAGGVFHHDGARYLNFSSNDYLNLSGNPDLQAGVVAAMDAHGCGATASRLMSGNLTVHEALESSLAALTGFDHALVFPSGFQANVGVVTSLAGAGDYVFSDALNHASIIDGIRLSRATTQVYRHNDTEHLAELLGATPATGRRIIVTDSVFSMDGDLAPVAALADLAATHNAIFVVDEAHAIGIWGGGGGVCKALGVRPDLVIGTLGKSLGSGGGFVACNGGFRDLLINRARSFIYSTGVSPMNAGAAISAVHLIQSEGTLGPRLLERARRFRELLLDRGVKVGPGESQIIPILVGDDGKVMALGEALLAERLIATGIRPPTVPEGTSRLRLTVTLAHDEAVLVAATEIIGRVLEG